MEGTDIAGCKVALIADTPKVMTEGNWRVGVFVDERGQRRTVRPAGSACRGRPGWTDGGACPVDRRDAGRRARPIEVETEGLRHRVRVGTAIDFEIEDVVPFGVVTGEPSGSPGCSTRSSDLTMAEAEPTRRRAPTASGSRGRPGCRIQALVAACSGRPRSWFSAVLSAFVPPTLPSASPGAGRRPGPVRWDRLVVDRPADARHGQRAVVAGYLRLVHQRLGRDHGGDDVSVGGSDGGVVLADDPEPVGARGMVLRGRLPGHLGGRQACVAFLVGMLAANVAPELQWNHAGRVSTGTTLLLAAAYEDLTR